jgi:hypothetical protein
MTAPHHPERAERMGQHTAYLNPSVSLIGRTTTSLLLCRVLKSQGSIKGGVFVAEITNELNLGTFFRGKAK